MNSADIKRLRMMIDLANKLDKKGLHKEADLLDSVISGFSKKAAEDNSDPLKDIRNYVSGKWDYNGSEYYIAGTKLYINDGWFSDTIIYDADTSDVQDFESRRQELRNIITRDDTITGDTLDAGLQTWWDTLKRAFKKPEEPASTPAPPAAPKIQRNNQSYIFLPGDLTFAYRLSKDDTAFKAYNVSDGSLRGEYSDQAGLQLVKDAVKIKLNDTNYTFLPGDSVYAYKLTNGDTAYDAYYRSTGNLFKSGLTQNIEAIKQKALKDRQYNRNNQPMAGSVVTDTFQWPPK